MGVKLSIEITSPLDEEDRDMLSGVAIMTLAIANHEMAKARFPEVLADDEDDDEDDEDDEEEVRAPFDDLDEPGRPADPVPAGTACATQGDTTPADDALNDRRGKGGGMASGPPPDSERTPR